MSGPFLFRGTHKIKISEDVVCYTAMISVLEKAGKWSAALHLFAEMNRALGAATRADKLPCRALVTACLPFYMFVYTSSLFAKQDAAFRL